MLVHLATSHPGNPFVLPEAAETLAAGSLLLNGTSPFACSAASCPLTCHKRGMLVHPRFNALQGFVLGQYGLLYALQHEEQVERLFVFNMPLALNSKLRPELAAYKSPIPFMRPGSVSGAGCNGCGEQV